jgi:2-dehydro-3-deoxyphosphogluconate aldolase / (4S)-4-hydroxy-2-oxoglutarate aldolase
MDKSDILHRILNPGVFAILRADSSDHLLDVAGALCQGGVTAMEVPMTTPDAMQVIAGIKKKFGDKILAGAGSILDPDTARAAILIGAEFIVTPVTKPNIIKTCNRYLKPVISGAYTPTEAFHAQESGADFIKIFPAGDLGPAYIRNILAPMPTLKLIPTGGVTVKNAAEYIHAGCVALAAASSLIPAAAVQSRDWGKITQAAVAFVEAVKMARR